MATLASLNVALTADSARLKKDLDKANTQTKKWSNNQKKNFAGVTKAITAMGVALGAVASVAAMRQLTVIGREISNLATLTNMSTEELQSMDPALRHAGVSTEKYADILKDTNDKVNDFLQTGGGPLRDFFEQIAPKVGVTTDAFKNLSGKEALGLYVSSLEKAGLSQEQMTFYMEALASDSTLLLPLLRNNAEAMRRFGLASNQVIKGGLVKTLARIGTQFEAVGLIIRNTLVNALEPMFNALLMIIEGWKALLTDFPIIIKGFGALAGAIAALTLVMLRNPITLWVTAIASLVALVGFLYYKFKEVSEAVGGTAEVFKLMSDSASFEIDRVIAFGEKLKLKMQMVFLRIKDAWTEMLNTMRMSFAEMMDGLADSPLGSLLGMEGGYANAAGAVNSAATNANMAEFERLSGAIQANSDALNAVNPHLKKLKEAWSGGKPMKVEVDPKSILKDLTGGGSLGATPEGEKDFFQTTAEQFVGGLKSSFSKALASGDWKGFLDSALDSLTMGIIGSFTEGLFKPFEESMTKWMGGLFDGMGDLGGSGIFGSIGGWLGGIFGAKDGGLVPTTPFSKSYADSVPTMLQPGELVVPKSQVDNFMNGAGGSGGGQTFNINVTGDVSRLTRSEIVKMMPEIAAGTNMLNKENGRR